MAPATRWGIVSAGLISHDFTTALGCLPESDHRVVAVAARNLDDAEKFSTLHNIPRSYGSYAELAMDGEVDVVYVGAINTVHLPIAKAMLEAGKNVLCEKPLCMNVKETMELVELARSKGLFLMEAVWSRFIPAYDALRKELAEGTIGEVLQVLVTFGQVIDAPRMHRKDLGGGTVLDLGIYCIQLASLVFGGARPEKVVAGGHLGKGGVDESTSATILYKDGKTATLLTHSRVALPCEALIVGTGGTMKLPFPMWTATQLETTTTKKVVGVNNISVETPAVVQKFSLPTGAKHKFNFKNSENFAHEASHVRECLLAGMTESPLVSLDETLVMAEIMESIRKQVGVVYPMD